MLCSSRILFGRNTTAPTLSASLHSSKHLLSNSKAQLRPSQVSSFSIPIKLGFSRPLSLIVRSDHSMATPSKNGSIYDFTVKDSKGNDVFASQCGLTNSNYTELNQLYEKYKEKGLEILAFPCNQFGSQEPGSNERILELICTRFKVNVNGDNAAPLYKFLKSSKGGIFGSGIKWNFSKFLIDKEGNVIARYAPTTSPLSIEKDIRKLLGA